MNLHERGKRLATIITGTIGLAAVVAASALGLHEWADSEATNLASADPSTGTATSTTETTDATDSSRTDSSSSAVSPATGSTPDGTSSGS